MSLVSTSKEILDDIYVEQFGSNLCQYISLTVGASKNDPSENIPILEDGLFTESIGKTVLYHQLLMRRSLRYFFKFNFYRMKADYKVFTYELCSRIYAFSNCSFCKKFFQVSAVVLELFLFCREYDRESDIHEEKLTKAASRMWKTIFDLVMKTDLHRQESGWAQIKMQSNYYRERVSVHFDPLLERMKYPYVKVPSTKDILEVFAKTDQELLGVFQRSYGKKTLSYIKHVLPTFLGVDICDDSDSENSETDIYERGCSPPIYKRLKD